MNLKPVFVSLTREYLQLYGGTSAALVYAATFERIGKIPGFEEVDLEAITRDRDDTHIRLHLALSGKTTQLTESGMTLDSAAEFFMKAARLV